MPTVLRVEAFRFRIYRADHEPPHVHVFRAGGQAKILLAGESGHESAPVLHTAYGMSARDLRRAMEIAEHHRDELLEAWRRHHG